MSSWEAVLLEKPKEKTPYNILFILTDQERYLDPQSLPTGYILPGRARLQRHGVTFLNHQINSAVCTSSRSVIYTGQHIQQTRLFDNLDYPWSYSLDPALGTIANLLTSAGYYTAYKGKWHLSRPLTTHDKRAFPDKSLADNLALFGFKDYVGIGDVIGETLGGYLNDDLTTADARRWLKVDGRELNRDGKPWYLAVNLVNPHDIMFFDTDAAGASTPGGPDPFMEMAPAPDTAFYRQRWNMALPATRGEAIDKPGRPVAHHDYMVIHNAFVGPIADEADRWDRHQDYYLNCILETDRMIESLLDELDALGLTEQTIIVMTSDHGELGGHHGMHGKGATVYQEQNHVPLLIAHPGYRATHGQSCTAVTSHLDLAPTMIAWAGLRDSDRSNPAGALTGVDLTHLLVKGAASRLDEVRDGSLYCYNMFTYLDGDLIDNFRSFLAGEMLAARGNPQGLTANPKKRGAIRSVFDGRYKYARYFSPLEHNRPETIEHIFASNDVELFDLQSDPQETDNLATHEKLDADLLLMMNAKLNALIDAEVIGPDDGSCLPAGPIDWTPVRFGP